SLFRDCKPGALGRRLRRPRGRNDALTPSTLARGRVEGARSGGHIAAFVAEREADESMLGVEARLKGAELARRSVDDQAEVVQSRVFATGGSNDDEAVRAALGLGVAAQGVGRLERVVDEAEQGMKVDARQRALSGGAVFEEALGRDELVAAVGVVGAHRGARTPEEGALRSARLGEP